MMLQKTLVTLSALVALGAAVPHSRRETSSSSSSESSTEAGAVTGVAQIKYAKLNRSSGDMNATWNAEVSVIGLGRGETKCTGQVPGVQDKALKKSQLALTTLKCDGASQSGNETTGPQAFFAGPVMTEGQKDDAIPLKATNLFLYTTSEEQGEVAFQQFTFGATFPKTGNDSYELTGPLLLPIVKGVDIPNTNDTWFDKKSHKFGSGKGGNSNSNSNSNNNGGSSSSSSSSSSSGGGNGSGLYQSGQDDTES